MLTFFNKDGMFSIKKFMDSERIIMSQWEDDEKVKDMNSRDLINRFTLYLGHINDEMKESADAYKVFDKAIEGKKENTNFINKLLDEYLKEILDVSMYISSVGNLFIKKMISLESEMKDIDIVMSEEFRITSLTISKDNNYYKDLRNCMFEITYRMSTLRELFPQRKWHKEFVPFDNAEFISVCKQALLICVQCITIFIFLSLYNSNGDYHRINELINEKQQKIVNDAIKNGSVKDKEHEEALHILYLQLNC